MARRKGKAVIDRREVQSGVFAIYHCTKGVCRIRRHQLAMNEGQGYPAWRRKDAAAKRIPVGTGCYRCASTSLL